MQLYHVTHKQLNNLLTIKFKFQTSQMSILGKPQQ